VLKQKTSFDQNILKGCLFLFILGMIFWFPARKFDFVWDDTYFIVENTAIRDWRQLPHYFTDLSTMSSTTYREGFVLFRPIRNISYLVDYTLFGYSPAGWHLHNVFIHSLNGVLLFLLLLRLKIPFQGAIFSSSIFLLHPLQTEVVCWVKSRDDLLAVCYSLLVMLLWAWVYKRASYKKVLPALCGLYFLGMLCKVQVVVIPGMLFLLAIYFEKSYRLQTLFSIFRKYILLWIGTIACAVVYLWWRHMFIGQSHQMGYLAGGFFKTQLTMTEAWRVYASLILLPLQQCADYTGFKEIASLSDPQLWVNITLFCVIFGLCFFLSRKNMLVAVGIGFICLGFLPVANFVPMMQFLAERFVYFPMIGVCMVWGALFQLLRKCLPGRVVAAFAMLICLVYASLTYMRMPVWENELTLFRQTTIDAPENAWRPWTNYLASLHRNQQYEEVISVSESIEQKVQEQGGIDATRHQKYFWVLGHAYFLTGEQKKGLEMLTLLQHTHPDFYDVYGGLGTLHGQSGNHEEAEKWLRKGLEIDPNDTRNLFHLALSLEKQRKFPEAFKGYDQVMQSPDATPKMYLSAAALYWTLGDFKGANRVYAEGLKKWPQHVEMRHWYDQSKLRI
jgi:tetratricopeptide (TPR) repeat protein